MPRKTDRTARPTGRPDPAPTPPTGRRIPVWAIVAVVIVAAGAAAIAMSASGGGGPDLESAEVRAEYGRPTVTGESLPPFTGSEGDEAVGREAPAVSGQDFAGEPVAIEPGGRALALLFVAHWCPHCRDEVPVVTEWLEGGNLPDDVDMIAVATGTDPARPNFPPSAWLQEEGWSEPVVVDADAYEVATAYGLTSFPFWVFVGADGTVTARDSGELTSEQLDEHVAELVTAS